MVCILVPDCAAREEAMEEELEVAADEDAAWAEEAGWECWLFE